MSRTPLLPRSRLPICPLFSSTTAAASTTTSERFTLLCKRLKSQRQHEWTLVDGRPFSSFTSKHPSFPFSRHHSSPTSLQLELESSPCSTCWSEHAAKLLDQFDTLRRLRSLLDLSCSSRSFFSLRRISTRFPRRCVRCTLYQLLLSLGTLSKSDVVWREWMGFERSFERFDADTFIRWIRSETFNRTVNRCLDVLRWLNLRRNRTDPSFEYHVVPGQLWQRRQRIDLPVDGFTSA